MQILLLICLVAFFLINTLIMFRVNCCWSLKIMVWEYKTSKMKTDVEIKSEVGDGRTDTDTPTAQLQSWRSRGTRREKQFNFHWEFHMAVRQKQAISLLSFNQWLTQTLEIMRNDTCVLSVRWTGLLKLQRFTPTVSSCLKHLNHPLHSTPPHPSH